MVIGLSPLAVRSVARLAGFGGAGAGAWARRRRADAIAIARRDRERVIETSGLSHGGFGAPARWERLLLRGHAFRCALRRGGFRASADSRCGPGHRARPNGVR